MLIYSKIVDGVRKLYGTTHKLPSEADQELVYMDRDKNLLEVVPGDTYYSVGNHEITRKSDNDKSKRFDVYIVEDGEYINAIPGTLDPTPVKKAIAFTITTEPPKQFEIYTPFTTAGMVIAADFDDGSHEEGITKGWRTFIDDHEIKEGDIVTEDATITVVFGDATATYNIDVIDPSVMTVYINTKTPWVRDTEAPQTITNDFVEKEVSISTIMKAEHKNLRVDISDLTQETFYEIALPKDCGLKCVGAVVAEGWEYVNEMDREIEDGDYIIYYTYGCYVTSDLNPLDFIFEAK